MVLCPSLMAKLFLLAFVWGPALLGFSLGWLIPHPEDWTGPAVVAPLGVIITIFTYRWGIRRARSGDRQLRIYFAAGMIASALVGVMIFLMLAFGIIG